MTFSPGPPLDEGLRSRALGATAWAAAQTWGSQAFSMLAFLVLARLLAPKDFGLIALAAAVIAFLETFTDQGFAQAIVQRAELEAEHCDTAFWTSFSISLALGALMFALADPLAELFHQPRLTNMLRVLALVPPLMGLNAVQQALYLRRLLFRALALRSLAANLTGGLVAVSLAVTGFGVWALVAQLLASQTIAVVVLWSASDWKPRFRFSTSCFRELYTYGINVVGINFLNFLNKRMDDLLIGYFLGAIALGYYSVGYRVVAVMTTLLTGTVSQVALPVFSRLQHDRERLVRGFYTATRLTALIAFPVFVSVAVLAPDVIHLLFGARWDRAIPVMQILAFVGILGAITYLDGNVIAAAGKPSWVLGLTAANAVGNVTAFAISVQWGIVAVALSYVIRGYLLSPLPMIALRRLIGIEFRQYLLRYPAPVVATAAMAAAMWGIRELVSGSPALNLATAGTAGAAVYLLAVVVMVPLPLDRLPARLRQLVRRSPEATVSPVE